MGLSKWLASEEDAKIHAAVDKIFGSWISKSGFHLKYSEDSVLANYGKIYYLALSGMLHLIVISSAIIIAYPDLDDTFNQIHILLLLFLCYSIIFAIVKYKKIVEQVATLLYSLEINMENDRDKKTMEIIKEKELYKNIVNYIVPKMFFCAWFLYISAGWTASLIDGNYYNNDNNILRLAPINTYWPSMGGYIILQYILPNFLQALTIQISATVMGGGATFFLVTMIYIQFNLRLIKHRAETINEISREINQKKIKEGIVEELRITQSRLIKETVLHHIAIKKCSIYFNQVFSTIMLFIFVTGGIDIGLAAVLVLFFEGNMAYKLEAVVLSIMEISMFGCLALSADHISHLSEEVSFSLYSAEWFGWSQDIKKMMLIMMSCSQEAILIKAGPMFIVNKEMFASLLQSTYSVINLFIASRSK